MRKQRIALKHDAAIGSRLARAGCVPSMRTVPRLGVFDAEQHFEERRLAAPRCADDGHELVIVDLQIDVLEHDLIAVLLPQVLDGHLRHAASAHANALARNKRSSQSMVNANNVIQAT
jgi:hypothetical protein